MNLASGDPADVRAGALPIDADARVRIATLREAVSMRVALDSPQAAYVVTDHGRIDIAGIRLEPRDGALVTGESDVSITAISDTDVVTVELLGDLRSLTRLNAFSGRIRNPAAIPRMGGRRERTSTGCKLTSASAIFLLRDWILNPRATQIGARRRRQAVILKHTSSLRASVHSQRYG